MLKESVTVEDGVSVAFRSYFSNTYLGTAGSLAEMAERIEGDYQRQEAEFVANVLNDNQEGISKHLAEIVVRAEEHKGAVFAAIFMSVAFALSFYPSKLEVSWSLWAVVGFSCIAVLLFAAAAYAYFGIGELKDILQQRFRNRFLKTRSA